MKRARAFGLWGASVVIAASFVYACSSSSEAVGGGSTGDKDATTGSGDDSGSLGSDDSGRSGDGSITPKKDGGDAATGPCGTSASTASCYQCCDGYSDGGVNAFFTYQDTCLCDTKHCGKTTTCKNTYCAATPPDDAGAKCNACLDKNLADDAGDGGCVDSTFDQCGANPSCAKGITCVIDSNCDSIP
ncbi:MAG: hypothetical protein ABI461_00455 [Polyangiaceae bacterium]